jgi:hypothetical protein
MNKFQHLHIFKIVLSRFSFVDIVELSTGFLLGLHQIDIPFTSLSTTTRSCSCECPYWIKVVRIALSVGVSWLIFWDFVLFLLLIVGGGTGEEL